MKKNILVIYAHPEPASLTRQLVEVTVETLSQRGNVVVRSDLYGMRWKAVLDADDFPNRVNPDRLSFIEESAHAYATHQQPDDVVVEQSKLLAADAVIMQFPMWWFGAPAILKGWIERVYAFGFGYGFKDGTNKYRYGEGALKGKRALVNVLTGGSAEDYGPRGINGSIEELLFPLTHGALFYPGMDVLPTHAVYSAGHVHTPEQFKAIKTAWQKRLEGLFDDEPIAFRPQNGGDYADRHTLRNDVAQGQSGLTVHISNNTESKSIHRFSEV